MKKILLASIVFGLVSCSSQKKLETTDIPFEMGQSTYQESLGGREESGTSAKLTIVISEEPGEVSFEKLFFRGRSLDCELRTKDGIVSIVAAYKKGSEVNMATDKAGRKMQESFELQQDQAIIAFKKGGSKLKYVKVEGVKEKAPILYRSKPKN